MTKLLDKVLFSYFKLARSIAPTYLDFLSKGLVYNKAIVKAVVGKPPHYTLTLHAEQ